MEQHFCNPLTIPGLAVGRDYLEGVYFEGNLFVDTTSDVGYVVVVSDTQSDSIQCLNFAKKWFNIRFNNALPKIQFKYYSIKKNVCSAM